MIKSKYKFDTLQIHAGARPDPSTGARQVPIYQNTAYVFKSILHAEALFDLKELGHIYSRLSNPTVSVLQERIAALEGGTFNSLLVKVFAISPPIADPPIPAITMF